MSCSRRRRTQGAIADNQSPVGFTSTKGKAMVNIFKRRFPAFDGVMKKLSALPCGPFSFPLLLPADADLIIAELRSGASPTQVKGTPESRWRP